jgi:hypothetical protein
MYVNTGDEKQVRGVEHLIRNRQRARQKQGQPTDAQQSIPQWGTELGN